MTMIITSMLMSGCNAEESGKGLAEQSSRRLVAFIQVDLIIIILVIIIFISMINIIRVTMVIEVKMIKNFNLVVNMMGTSLLRL